MIAPNLDYTPPAEHLAAIDSRVMDAVVRQLQQAAAADVDKGLKQLLQALLTTTHARYVSCTLEDASRPFGRVTVFTETIGLFTVDAPPASAAAVATLDVQIQPQRHLVLHFSPSKPESPINLAAVAAHLGALQRWLLWLDLTHGPLTSKGVMPPHLRRVLLALLRGLSEKQIAAELELSFNTAHQYVTALYRRYKVRNRASLMAMWLGPVGTTRPHR